MDLASCLELVKKYLWTCENTHKLTDKWKGKKVHKLTLLHLCLCIRSFISDCRSSAEGREKKRKKKKVSFFSSERQVKPKGKSDLYSIICLLLSKCFTEERFITYTQDHFSLTTVIAFHRQASFPLTHLFVLMWLLEITHNHPSLLPFCLSLLQQVRLQYYTSLHQDIPVSNWKYYRTNLPYGCIEVDGRKRSKEFHFKECQHYLQWQADR